MQVLIADDEPIARQVLRELLADCPGIEVAGEACTGAEVLDLVLQAKPDLVFLDVQMPAMDGLAVARALRGSPLPLVIYVTAYETHALEAFETGAVDYLLKPVRRERLTAALDKARAQLAGLRPAPVEPTEPRRIAGRRGATVHLLGLDDVVAFQASGDVVVIHTTTGWFYAEYSLRAVATRLPSSRFRRVHRSTIINVDHIRTLTPLSSKRWQIRLTGGLEATVSKRMAGAIRDATRW
jgi:DNA-binding LytR/AlgR family response regulator